MEETVIAQKVLVLCEDREAGRWMASLLEELDDPELSLEAAAAPRDSLEGMEGLRAVLVFASRLGEELGLALETLKATYPGVRIMVISRDLGLETARRALELGADELVTPHCRRDVLCSLLQGFVAEEGA
ncbi:MAG: hypothetical protein HY721_29765 [Planctomycetes bacterium]|nr:hypothetical protein [Planctomycetota bacterium]